MSARVKISKTEDQRWFDPWMALIVLSVITLVAVRLWATEWTGDLYVLVYITFFGGLSGIALGYSRFSPLISALFSTVYGTFTIGWLFGTTVEPTLSWYDRILNVLGWRLQIAIQQFAAGKALTDPILFLALMAVLLWVLGSISAFILIREGSVWSAFIPLGITLLVVSQYDQNLARNSRYLLTFLFLLLLALGRIQFLRNKQTWENEGIYTTTETHADLNKSLLVVTCVLLILAWIIPVTPQGISRYSRFWENLTEPWERFTEQISDIFVLESGPTTSAAGFFGESMGLGSGTPASEAVIFTVEVTSAPPVNYRNYWRARSYDRYVDADWSTSPGLVEYQLFPNSFDLVYPDWLSTQPASYLFTIITDRMDNLYFVGEPTAVSRPAEALAQPLPESTSDLIALLPDPVFIEGDTYSLDANVRLPTEAELRSTSTDYPEWLDRYLQLPEDFSPEVAALADRITDDLDHPFGQAAAITRYLRINIEYSRTIPPVPPGADPIEWFLFEEKKGFCNYYATAQVLMLRSLGIPARMSVGYAEGEFDPETDTYTVRRRDSHAWPEVYFMDYGWVAFEPTTSQPAVILPLGLQPIDEDRLPQVPGEIPQMDDAPGLQDGALDGASGDLSTPPETQRRFEGSQIIWTILTIFMVGLVIALLVIIRPNFFRIKMLPLPVVLESALLKRGKSVPDWLHRWRLMAQMSVAQRAYRQLERSIKLLRHPVKPSDTPAERAQVLIQLLPDAQQHVLEILNEYHLDQFSNHIINEERAKKAGRLLIGMALKTRLRSMFSFGSEK